MPTLGDTGRGGVLWNGPRTRGLARISPRRPGSYLRPVQGSGDVTLDTHGCERAYRRWPLRVGFVNNMPDAAFASTYDQFAGLIRGASAGRPLELRCFYLPEVPRDRRVLERARLRYREIEALYVDPPDALVITGTEPRSADLAGEPYWDALSTLIRWAEATVASTLLSCLASHAAVLALDGIGRRRLASKQSGVFYQEVDTIHPLAPGLGAVAAFPHSRMNEIPLDALRGHGYRVVVSGVESGWSVATRESGRRLLVLLQSHPEYDPATLLKEYRRDVRRYLEGSSSTHPEPPTSYLDAPGLAALEEFRARCEAGPSRPSIQDFPYEETLRYVRSSWRAASQQLFVNWLADAEERAALVAT
jgi:homoserine O-succinyltransferase